MSESSAKATRRELRRAMGAQGVQVVADTQKHIALLSQALASHDAKFKAQDDQFREIQLALKVHAIELTGAREAQTASTAVLRRTSFRERLAWLLFGV